jgi:hypothetical protein
MQYGFDLIFPPYKIANMSTDSIELVSNSILRVGLGDPWTVIVRNEERERSWREISSILDSVNL